MARRIWIALVSQLGIERLTVSVSMAILELYLKDTGGLEGLKCERYSE